jgi:hypothetical protein
MRRNGRLFHNVEAVFIIAGNCLDDRSLTTADP